MEPATTKLHGLEMPSTPRRKTQVLFAKVGIRADRAAHTHCCEHLKCYSYSIYFPLELTSLRLLPFYLFLLPFFPFLGSLIWDPPIQSVQQMKSLH